MLENHQWELTGPDMEPGFVFGTLATGIQTATAPDLGSRDPRTADREMAREDGVAFGTDYEGGTSITFECNVLTSGWGEQSDLLNRFWSEWAAKRYRNGSGAYAVLKSHAAGRTRICYGRPRRFAEADGDLTHEGYTGVVCDFATRDGKFYDEAVQIEDIPIAPPGSVGFTTPIIVNGIDPNTVAFQTDDLDPGQIPGNVTVEGEETWPWIEIHAPSNYVWNPSIQLGDNLTIELSTVVPAGDYVLLDPRPWSRRAIRGSDGANVAGRLTWATPRMADWLLQPGSYDLTFRGDDPTNTAFARVQWRNAYHRP